MAEDTQAEETIQRMKAILKSSSNSDDTVLRIKALFEVPDSTGETLIVSTNSELEEPQ